MKIKSGHIFSRKITKTHQRSTKNIDAISDKSIHQAESLAKVLATHRLGEIPQLLAPNIILKSSRVILEIMDSSGNIGFRF